MWRNFPFAKIALCCLSINLVGCAGLFGNSASTADVYLQLGLRYLSMDRLDLAKINLYKAVEKDGDSVQAHNGLAYLYEKLKNPGEALKHYEIAMKLDPTDLGVQNNFGRFLCDQKQYDRGMALLKQSASTPLNNRPWLALTNAGRCLMSMGQNQQAEPYFQQALLQNGNYSAALAEMQKLSYLHNDFSAANEYLQRYLSTAQHTPETLWIAIHTERAQGNNELATEYQNLLLKKFPLSDEANKIKSVLW